MTREDENDRILLIKHDKEVCYVLKHRKRGNGECVVMDVNTLAPSLLH